MGLFEMMMGKLGLSILAWLQEHMDVALGVLIAYFVVVYAAKYQMRRIEMNTIKLIQNTITNLKKKNHSPSVSTVLKSLKPVWIEQSKRWALFILGKFNLYPIPYRPEKNFEKFVTRELVKTIISTQDVDQ